MRVVVIGGGMAGLTAARLMADGGYEVTVLDKGRRPVRSRPGPSYCPPATRSVVRVLKARSSRAEPLRMS